MATRMKTRPAEPDQPRKSGSRSDRIAMALPGVLMAGVLVFFIATKTSEAGAALKSLRAILVIAGIAAGWIVLSLVLRRLVRWPWVRAGVLGAAGVALSIVLILPYYQDTKVVERAQDVLGAEVVRPDTATTLPPTPDDPPPPPSVAGPVQVTTGTFQGIDHSATGGANLIRREDGRFVVELRDIDIQNGPDYDVYLVEGEDRQGKDGGVKLDDLRGNIGTQYYDVPGDVTPGPGWTVLIWCEAFGVPVANATQTAA